MASIPTPTTAMAAANFSTLPSFFFLKGSSQASTIRSQKHIFKVSCKAKDSGDHNQNGGGTNFYEKVDRRNVLIGLGGLYGAANLAVYSPAFAGSYDENVPIVRVKVMDCLDNRRLRYVYQDVTIPWLNTKPNPRISKLSRKIQKSGVAIAAETPFPMAAAVFPKRLDEPVTVTVAVPRPKKSRSKKEKEEEEEILVVDGIEFAGDEFVKFDVFVNDEEDDARSGPANTEFAGSFVNVPKKHKESKRIKTRLRLGITDLLEDLGAEDDESVVVTLVPKYGSGRVAVGGVRIEFEL